MPDKYRPIRKFRTCNGCKAMVRGWCGHPDECTLGYTLEQCKGPYGIRIAYPGEHCPKPKTNMELVDSPAKWELPPPEEDVARGK